MNKSSIFESTECGRCGGSGHFSYNAINGTRCFGCGGAGIVLTKRGKAAQTYYRNMNEIKISDVKPGMKIIWMNTGYTVVSVSEIKPAIEFGSYQVGNEQQLTVQVTTANSRIQDCADRIVSYRPAGDEYAEKIAKALAYQETLTKNGTERKRK